MVGPLLGPALSEGHVPTEHRTVVVMTILSHFVTQLISLMNVTTPVRCFQQKTLILAVMNVCEWHMPVVIMRFL